MSEQNIESSAKEHFFRDPIHGLVRVYDWEKEIINTEAFQRLKRIHQLSLTNYIYHGAEHTRFGHSIGTMHVAGRVMDHLRSYYPLKNKSEDEFNKLKYLVRLAGLLHDIGHSCYSHVGEQSGLFPMIEINGQHESGHEAYTQLIVKEKMSDILNRYYDKTGICAEEIIEILSQGTADCTLRFIDDIISGQLDIDKMDYLLRDSYYCGVKYGVYDLERLIQSLRVVEIDGTCVLGINQHGIQTVEEFVFARYWMFIQVYFHKYRRIYDLYLSKFLKCYLKNRYQNSGEYPQEVDNYLNIDDNVIFEKIKEQATKRTKDETEEEMHRYAGRIYFRKHHKIAFDPPYVHYERKGANAQIDEYKQLDFVFKKVEEYQNSLSPEKQRGILVDQAKGSSFKDSFSIPIYSSETNPDMDPHLKTSRAPSIPVIKNEQYTKYRPIQDYSFSLRSISDKSISILRVYADADIVDDIAKRCNDWSEEYLSKQQQLGTKKELLEFQKAEVEKTQAEVKLLEQQIDSD